MATGLSINSARSGLGISLSNYRRYPEFRAREAACLSSIPVESQQYEYLYQLQENVGNDVKAARAAGVRWSTVQKWKNNEQWFAEAEAEVFREIRAEAFEQNARLATGKDAKVKDGQHLRWFLAHIDKENWGEQAKEVKHSYTGSVDLKVIDQQILELLDE